MICTTLNKIRAHNPCGSGWSKLLKHLGKTQSDDEALPLSVIVASNGLDDALWALRTLPEHNNLWRHYAVWCARQVQHLMTDRRSLAALDVAERHAIGEATDEELAAAWDVARAARAAAWAAGDVARAAGDAAWAARDAAWAAWDVARAARAAAWAAGAAQKEKLLIIVGEA
jgi:hypothetical protein